MERESFEDEEVAEILNKYFVCIKVDREERPDVDSIYMNVCQALTGSGGWPLNVFITPDKKPFYAGTYFPKKSRARMFGIIELAEEINKAWTERRNEVIKSSVGITEEVQKNAVVHKKEEIGKEVINEAYKAYQYSFDKIYGGFGNAPKFPTSHNLSFLLKYYKYKKEKFALEIVEKTLESMYKGGIFDHIGYGFSRYSVDKKWLIPHFEKMLYDNALLAYTYIEAYETTNNELYKSIAEKIFAYVLRDMTSEEGGFYSAEDADSEGVEGKFYVWELEEIEKILGKKESKLFSEFFDITKEGNFEEKNIPNLIHTDLKDIEKNKEKLEGLRQKLYDYRENRIHPFKDNKILTSWNGLMVSALAYGGKVFKNKNYIEAAEKSVKFILEKLVREDGRILARYREGESAILAYSEDYAFLIWGLIELHEVTDNKKYLDKALELSKAMLELFWDEKEGGFLLYGKDGEKLIINPKEIYDGAIPSANSVQALNMLRLAKLSGDKVLENKSNEIFKVFGGTVKSNPSAYSYLMSALIIKFR